MESFFLSLKSPYTFVANKFQSRTKTQQVSSSESWKSNVFHSILSPFETYVVSFQSLLIWERPFISAVAFVTINIVYWLIVSWNRRLFSILSIFAVVLFGYKTWVYQVWPEIKVPPEEGEDTESWTAMNPSVLSVPEVSRYLNDFFEKTIVLWKDVWKLRKENHGLFCALMCAFFSILGILGEIVPGVLIIYTLVLLVSLGPGIALHLLPPNLYDQMIGFFVESDSQGSDASKSGSKSDKDSDVEEFLPEEMNEEVLRNLSLRSDVPEVPSPSFVLTGSMNMDSLLDPNNSIMGVDELYEGLGSFPSLDDEGETDSSENVISENSLLPGLEPVKEEMKFVTSHFKEDSSESDNDGVFTEGMSFSKSDDLSLGTESDSHASISERRENLSKQKLPSASDLVDDDDLSDFEILEESEIANS